ncbi:DNA-binding transcriptional MocR family regulator [Allocatelliglobosispora scoriae]|uniref:DNA-binding transcriptional MocR family regulator n=1 Tax=Allocatelliglobosispora scoriae TaxID=643052 RepID=A0A841BW68_9ACTN|nr:PLP-dependent aminotransferase family protein [Allocatelliglobosispora scoriae]MBB5871718.1 DNA-binding transcriptional MocR family regulator [Allocatelliglobosispora scoriae]
MLSVVQFTSRPGILDLGWGHPSADALPGEAWAAAVAQTMAEHGPQALAYGFAPGPAPLREWLADHLATTDTLPVDPEQIFVTAGASHALDLVTSLLTGPGDVVLTGSPTYHLAPPILTRQGAEVLPLPGDDDGIDPAAARRTIDSMRRAGRRIALLYLVPVFANPTGRSLPADRRAALIGLARRGGFPIVEDDTYRELWFGDPAPPSLWSESAGSGVIRIGSFAKTVAPGLRLGFVTADRDLVDRLAGLGFIVSGGGINHFAAMTLAVFGTSGRYADHVARLRHHYADRRDTLTTALRRARPELLVPDPAGGWFVWLPLPTGVTATRLIAVAERHGVSFVPGTQFHPGSPGAGSGAGDDRIRLAFSMLTDRELVEAAGRLAAALERA